MPYQAPNLDSDADSSAASQASESSDSTVSSGISSVLPPSNAEGLDWMVYNPPTNPGGLLLAVLRLWLMSRR